MPKETFESESQGATQQVMGQISSMTATFELASIKPDKEAEGMHSFEWPSPGTFKTQGVTVATLLRFAYGLQSYQIVGSPGWTTSERFDILAQANEAVSSQIAMETDAQRAQDSMHMLQGLLADRFKLVVHHESKDFPVFVLLVDKNGPKFHEAQPDDTYLGGLKDDNGRGHAGMIHVARGEIVVQGLPVAKFIEQLSAQTELRGRTLRDETGLDGIYNFTLRWSPEVENTPDFQGIDNSAASDLSGPSLFTALREQLGLKLESRRAPVDVLVIDSIQEPSEN